MISAGDSFGQWTIVEQDLNCSKVYRKWICRCTCGVIRSVIESNLKRGLSKGCGCTSPRSFVDLHGRKFGRLLVKSISSSRGGLIWRCICDCGNEKDIPSRSLLHDSASSCGCLRNDRIRESNSTHSMSNSKEYKVWCAMKTRCTNPNRDNYKYYGGRGIKVCKEWLESFETFYKDMGPCPSPEHTIERDDVDADYSPGNCKWVHLKEQAFNKRNSIKVVYKDNEISLSKLVRDLGLDYDLMYVRISNGWSVEDAIEKPKRHSRKLY